MKQALFSVLVILMISGIPGICIAQQDSSIAKAVVSVKSDSASVNDSTTVKLVNDSTTVVSTPMNCYKQWLDAFAERSVKPMTDGMQEVVIAFKSKESCHCYMGKVEISGGKIKTPVYVQTDGGNYKTFVELGKKLDPEFIAVQGEGLWQVTNGMSVLFQSSDQEYGRIFFYKSLNKNKQASKEAPSPAELLK